jgi:hypothetical protein
VKHGPVWAGHAAQQCNPCRASLGRDFQSRKCTKRERGRTAARAGCARQAGGPDPPQAKANARYQAGSTACFPVKGAARQSPSALEKCGPKMKNSLRLRFNSIVFSDIAQRPTVGSRHRSVSFSSIRRFCARASGLSPAATGRYSPNPVAAIRSGGKPSASCM